MGGWKPIGFRFLYFLVLIFGLQIHGCWSLNTEGLALLEFRARVSSDPHGAFVNWNPNENDPCKWMGVYCIDGAVQVLDLNGLSLEGTLAPELANLSQLRSLLLHKNHFSGFIPKEFGGLKMLELLDLRDNNLSGTIPAEMGSMLSLKRLLLCDNKFEGSIPVELGRLSLLSELQFDENLRYAETIGIGCVNRKLGHCIWQSGWKQLNKAESLVITIKSALQHYLSALQLPLLNFEKHSLPDHGDNCCDDLHRFEPHIVENVQKVFVRRRLLEQSSNLAAAPPSDGATPVQIIAQPTTRSSGAYPAVPGAKKKQAQAPTPPHTDPLTRTAPNQGSQFSSAASGQYAATGNSGDIWKYVIIGSGAAILLVVAAVLLVMCRRRGVTTIGPWKTGLSGQLQKAFITGVPKLNRSELETACEDFSNILDTLDGCIMYKGTLSSGVEIAVASSVVTSSKDWSKNAEIAYRKKIDTLSRINHKNFVNLLGFSEDDEPFNRMMVFEYAPNGSLFEHLHVKEMEHLDWNARMRIIMGVAYCLQYMHHDLNPPIAHSNLHSAAIYLTDDYAAKIAENIFSVSNASKPKILGDDESNHSVLPPLADPETNIYSLGILMLEIISGKLPYSEEEGPLEKWAAEYLNDKRTISYMIDPTLKSFKNNELDVICEVIQDCIQPDPRKRPTMKDVASKLREVINISPDQATPRLSPLWWAELEILSVEAT